MYSITTQNPAYLIEARHGAVASENKRCSVIGVDVMKEGGNAVDAAIATTFCVGVVNMFSSGIGGGGFMTVRIPPNSTHNTSEVWTIDFREAAPGLANKNMYVDDPDTSRFGALAIAVPGELRGLEEAHRRWGTLPWKRLVMPAAELAAGWTVDRELARRIQHFYFLMLGNPDYSAIFAPKGLLLREGDLIRRTNYSNTLFTIARHGPSAFYKGPIADALVSKIRSSGGILTHADLEGYKVKVNKALEGTYFGRKVYTTHAPTSGPVILQMFNLMEHYGTLREDGRTGVNVHRLVEAMKFGFAARTKICDPAFSSDMTTIHNIPTKEYANLIAPNITDNQTHPPEYYNPEYSVHADHGTSHNSIIDNDGMAVAITTSVNMVFGAFVLDPVTGVIFDDTMDDFSNPGVPDAWGIYASPYNYPEPHKRPLSSMAPLIMEHADGSLYLAAGGSGGSRIFGGIFQTVLNLDWGLDASQAVEFGRVHDQLYPTELEIDEIYPPELIKQLARRGHNITMGDINRIAAVVNIVTRQPDGIIFAASDSRKNGIAAGY
ncbi:hypothetical protein PILCRDRAFT_824014 [Piloderma croceum F 1598]|uniref:Gamma-glutamyltranspeptidase n=1 Tax=Piloderma croceum (strain F 1598) TaxID=765440 RepID=A0A0C3F275_PILCF|nr:hypothetical protein PILCRDRAFT_824014 [Piloderma croceum F 1598]